MMGAGAQQPFLATYVPQRMAIIHITNAAFVVARQCVNRKPICSSVMSGPRQPTSVRRNAPTPCGPKQFHDSPQLKKSLRGRVWIQTARQPFRVDPDISDRGSWTERSRPQPVSGEVAPDNGIQAFATQPLAA